MKSGTPNHIKTKRLKRRLGLKAFEVIGVLESLWQLTADCADDGAIGRHTNEDIAAYMEWEGSPDELVAALVDSGWLDHDKDDRLVIHDWEDHMPHYIKERIQKRGWRRKQRTCDEKTPDSPGTVQQLSGQCPALSWDVLAQPNPTQPNQGKPRESKAKQTKGNSGKIGSSYEEPCADESAPDGLPDADQVREVFSHYRKHHPRSFPKAKSDSREWKLVRKRLLEGYTVEQLKAAIDGCHRSPFHCGENQGGKLYQSLELIVRDATHVNQFLEVPERGQGPPVTSERTKRNQRAAESYLARRTNHEHQRPAGILDGAASVGGDVQPGM